jgi:hypothetical protein
VYLFAVRLARSLVFEITALSFAALVFPARLRHWLTQLCGTLCFLAAFATPSFAASATTAARSSAECRRRERFARRRRARRSCRVRFLLIATENASSEAHQHRTPCPDFRTPSPVFGV